MRIYFNPLDLACKTKQGAIKQGEKVQFNIFVLRDDVPNFENRRTPKKEYCIRPTQKAYLQLNCDGEDMESFSMQSTAFGWTISLAIHEIGLYFYSFYIENVGNISCGYLEMGYISEHANGFLL